MDAIIRAFNRHHAQRRLRDLLLDHHETLELDLARVPHAFDGDRVLDLAGRVLRRRRAIPLAVRLDLTHATGVLAGVIQGFGVAEEWFERGGRQAAHPADEARFAFLIAHHVFRPRGEMVKAREALGRGLARAETHHELRSLLHLALARVARESNDLPLADHALEEALRSRATRYRPLAAQSRAKLRALEGRLDEALVEAARARELMVQAGSEIGTVLVDTDRAMIHRLRGEDAAARERLADVARYAFRVLDLKLAGNTANNVAASHERMGDLTQALAGYLDAWRFHRESDRADQHAVVLRNIGLILGRLSQVEAALAALDRSAQVAESAAELDLALRAWVDAVEILSERGDRRLSAAVDRALALVGDPGLLNSTTLARLARLVGGILVRGGGPDTGGGHPGPLVTEAGREELDRRLAEAAGPLTFRDRLRRLVGAGVTGREAPDPEELTGFLQSFAGASFPYRRYAGEFPGSPAVRKAQLQELTERGILARVGERKATRYELAFHRELTTLTGSRHDR